MPRKGYFKSWLAAWVATAESNFQMDSIGWPSLTFNVAAVACFPGPAPEPRGGLMPVVLQDSASGAVGPVAIPISAACGPQ
jgi:hypothetical protein